jgi:UDPglucose 6-dehydrogenase
MHKNIGIVGLSHLGVVYSIGLTSFGFDVTGIDLDAQLVRRLEQGDCIHPEPSLPELMEKHRAQMSFTTDFSKLGSCDVVLFSQDTVITETNDVDLSRTHALIDAMIPHLKEGVTLFFMSQVPVGTTRALAEKIRSLRGENFHFSLHYWVEVLVIGDAVSRFYKPGRIIIGHEKVPGTISAQGMQVLRAFDCPILDMNYESAELTKSAINIFLATSVTFANTLSDLCEAVGADMTEIIPALKLDKRIGPFSYVKPGLGLSGGHLERDLVALSRLTEKHDLPSTLLTLIQKESADRFLWLRKKIESLIFAKNSSPHIALWGLSYKKNTDSTHGAPSLKVIADFGKRATLTAYDPVVKLPSTKDITLVSDRYEALMDADGLLILSDWEEFKDLDIGRLKKAMKMPLIIDPLGVLSELQIDLARESIRYVTMGRA